MTKTRKKRTKPGNSPLFCAARVVVALLALGLLCLPVRAAKDGRQPAAYAVVAGTVFRDSGLSLAGAEVELAASGSPEVVRKFKKMKQISDARGEFAFRVPVSPAEYTLSVKARGYQAEDKPVSVSGEQRFDVFFRLSPASK